MKSTRASRPHFLWTGLLILLPVAGLGLLGVHQLRQDRAAALDQARKQASFWAYELTRFQVVEQWDLKCNLDRTAELIDFMPFTIPPQPVEGVWIDARKLAEILEQTERPAKDRLWDLQELAVRAHGLMPDGTPIGPRARYEALRIAGGAEILAPRLRSLAGSLAGHAVRAPSAMTPKYLDAAAPYLERKKLRYWMGQWQMTKRVQEFLRSHRAEILELIERVDLQVRESGMRFVTETLESDPPVTCRIRLTPRGNYHLSIRSGVTTGPKFSFGHNAWERLPEHFGAKLWVGGELHARQRAEIGTPILASLETNELNRAEIFLFDPEHFFAFADKRSRTTALLIILAGLAALAGWLASWRAFHRQRKLTVMKDNFVSAVSHELKSPIAAIGLMAEELGDEMARDPERRQHYARLISGECSRLGSLVQNVLDYARFDSDRNHSEFEEADLGEIARSAAELMKPAAAERGMVIDVDAPMPGELCATVDARALGRALVNLLDNAIKYAPIGTAVRLKAEGHGTSGFRFSVLDHGPVIPPQDRDRIFERFVRAGSELTRETTGVGIGLSLVRHVAAAHGGRAWVDSDGKGNHFHLEGHGQ